MPRQSWFLGTGLVAVLIGNLVSCTGDAPVRGQKASLAQYPNGTPIDPEDPGDLGALLDAIDDSRVVMIGETHDRYDHHLNQLAVIRGLHERGVPLAVGMEAFQRPFQPHLDAFVAGDIDEDALLERTEWAQRWRFDPRLYRDILDYVRAERIPLVALNAPVETVHQVSMGGIDGLGTEQRALFPARIALATGAYRRHLETVFSLHGDMPPERLERFLQVQYVWDQTMARSAADYLADNPDRTMIVLAGSGHLLHDDAIPKRLRRLQPGKQTVLITDTGFIPDGAEPDYVFAARDLLPGDQPRLARSGGDH